MSLTPVTIDPTHHNDANFPNTTFWGPISYNGNLYALMWHTSGTPPLLDPPEAWFHKSTDNGATWTRVGTAIQGPSAPPIPKVWALWRGGNTVQVLVPDFSSGP